MAVRAERHPGQILVVVDTGNPRRRPRADEVIDPQPAPTITVTGDAGKGVAV